jgi:hypothetical protein
VSSPRESSLPHQLQKTPTQMLDFTRCSLMYTKGTSYPHSGGSNSSTVYIHSKTRCRETGPADRGKSLQWGSLGVSGSVTAPA